MTNKNRINITGERFGRLYALRDVGTSPNGRLWHCLCSCGKSSTVCAALLRAGKTSSCGCALDESRVRVGQENARKGFGTRLWHQGVGVYGNDVDALLMTVGVNVQGSVLTTGPNPECPSCGGEGYHPGPNSCGAGCDWCGGCEGDGQPCLSCNDPESRFEPPLDDFPLYDTEMEVGL
jgi:hypothetical protein